MLLHAFLFALPWIGAVLVIAVAARFAEEEPGNGTEHQSVDEPRDPDPPELLVAA